MIIRKKRIHIVDKFIKWIETDYLMVCVDNNYNTRDTIVNRRVVTANELQEGISFVPAGVGPVTIFNSQGKEIVMKDKEKEPRQIDHDYKLYPRYWTDES